MSAPLPTHTHTHTHLLPPNPPPSPHPQPLRPPLQPHPLPSLSSLGTIDYLAPEILDCPVKQHPEDHKDRPDTGYTNKVGVGVWV